MSRCEKIGTESDMSATLLDVYIRARALMRKIMILVISFFFSGRSGHTIFDCDWSSDVCSSDLGAAVLANKIVAYTQDYADPSRLLSHFRNKMVVIPPPVIMPQPPVSEVRAFEAAYAPKHQPVIGFAARFAAEKGVEFLLTAMPRLLTHFPQLKVLFAGPFRDVLGEEAYWERLRPEIERLDGHWEFL